MKKAISFFILILGSMSSAISMAATTSSNMEISGELLKVTTINEVVEPCDDYKTFRQIPFYMSLSYRDATLYITTGKHVQGGWSGFGMSAHLAPSGQSSLQTLTFLPFRSDVDELQGETPYPQGIETEYYKIANFASGLYHLQFDITYNHLVHPIDPASETIYHLGNYNIKDGFEETFLISPDKSFDVMFNENLEWVYAHVTPSGRPSGFLYQRFDGQTHSEATGQDYYCLYQSDSRDFDASAATYLGAMRRQGSKVFILPANSDLPSGYWSSTADKTVNPFTEAGDDGEILLYDFAVRPGEDFMMRDWATGRFERLTVESALRTDDVKIDDSHERKIHTVRIKFTNGVEWLQGIGSVGIGSTRLAYPSLLGGDGQQDAVRLVMVRDRRDGSVIYKDPALYDAVMSGVEGIEGDNMLDSSSESVYYNLQGQRVAHPADGVFIRRQGTSASKVVVP